MAEPKKAAAAPAPPPARVLARASESGDPAVHQVMAELQSAQMNADPDKAAELTKQLADLGFE